MIRILHTFIYFLNILQVIQHCLEVTKIKQLYEFFINLSMENDKNNTLNIAAFALKDVKEDL